VAAGGSALRGGAGSEARAPARRLPAIDCRSDQSLWSLRPKLHHPLPTPHHRLIAPAPHRRPTRTRRRPAPAGRARAPRARSAGRALLSGPRSPAPVRRRARRGADQRDVRSERALSQRDCLRATRVTACRGQPELWRRESRTWKPWAARRSSSYGSWVQPGIRHAHAHVAAVQPRG
jgi:hypothetical protein